MSKSKPIKDEFKEGDIVETIKDIDYSGTPIRRYDSYYVITGIVDDVVALSAKRDKNYYFWAFVNINNIKKVEG